MNGGPNKVPLSYIVIKWRITWQLDIIFCVICVSGFAVPIFKERLRARFPNKENNVYNLYHYLVQQKKDNIVNANQAASSAALSFLR